MIITPIVTAVTTGAGYAATLRFILTNNNSFDLTSSHD